MSSKSKSFVMAKVDEQKNYAKNLIEDGLSKWQIDRDDRRLISQILFSPNLSGRPILGNQAMRRLAIEAMVDVMRGAFGKDNRHDLFLITFCIDEGMTWEYQPVVDFVTLGRKIDRALRRLGVSGVGAFEFDSFRPIAGDGALGRRIWTHAHVIARCKRGGFDHVAKEREINALPSFRNCLGARPVDISPIHPTAPDLARVAAYLFEFQHHTKLVKRMPGGFKAAASVRAGFELPTVLRLAELETRIALPDLVFGVGPIGTELRRRWKARFDELRTASSTRKVDVGDVADTKELWERLRAHSGNGSRRYTPCDIITRSGQYALSK